MSEADANFMRACRDRLVMTQVEFAALLGVGIATMKRYESGREDVPESVRLSSVVLMGLADRVHNVYRTRADKEAAKHTRRDKAAA